MLCWFMAGQTDVNQWKDKLAEKEHGDKQFKRIWRRSRNSTGLNKNYGGQDQLQVHEKMDYKQSHIDDAN